MGARWRFSGATGAHTKSAAGRIQVDPQASKWTATWSNA